MKKQFLSFFYACLYIVCIQQCCDERKIRQMSIAKTVPLPISLSFT